MAFRDQFPVLDRLAYLNAGTDGPIPRAAIETARAELEAQGAEGRLYAHFARRFELADQLRAGYARPARRRPEDVAVTSGTSAGLGAVLAGLDIGPGDEIVTSDAEHPGLIGPLIAARERGATIKAVPFAELANAVTATTTLVAASHVSWITGELAPAELAEVSVPVILDGAQGIGAVPVDVTALGCVAYAGPGQKWLCGADGTGMLYLDPEFGERVKTVFPTYFSFEDTASASTAASSGREPLRPAAAARGRGALRRRRCEVLEAEGVDAILTRAADLATASPPAAEAGYTVAPRARTTLVSFEVEDPEAEARATARARRRGPQPPGHAVPARLGRRLERRVRPRSPARSAAVNAVCVYCGSSFGAKPAYAEATKQLAIALAERNLSRRLRRRVRRPDGPAGRHRARARRSGRRRDPTRARRSRGRAPRPDRAARRRVHARAQGARWPSSATGSSPSRAGSARSRS